MAERFDPRFNPVFQPGFDPSRDAAPPGPRTEGAAGSEHVAEPLVQVEAEPATPADDVEDPAIERNPFERTLWILSAALVIGGTALTYWANSVNVYYTTPSVDIPWYAILQQSAWSLSQPTITVGLGTAVALLFRRAVTWKSVE